MSETPLKTPSRATAQAEFGSLTGVIIPSTEAFFESIESFLKSQPPNQIQDEMLIRFLVSADAYAIRCCQELAGVIREISSHAEVRETTEAVLSRLIRNRCFEGLDTILTSLATLLVQGGISIGSILPQLGDSRLKDGLKSPYLTPEPLNGANPRSVAVFKIWEYLKAFESLPQALLEYGAAKVFRGEIDFSTIGGFVFNIQDAIQGKWSSCLTAVECFDAVKDRMWEEQRVADLAVLKEAAFHSIVKTSKKKKGAGFLIAGAISGLLGWLASMSGINHLYVFIASISLGAIGIICMVIGLVRLTKD